MAQAYLGRGEGGDGGWHGGGVAKANPQGLLEHLVVLHAAAAAEQAGG